MSVKSLREQHADATRAALLDAGRELFVAKGFAGVSAEEIARHARVTRGALYHHFKDKSDLFGEVCDALGAELSRRVSEAIVPMANEDPWTAMGVGINEFLDACTEGEFHRLVIVEAPVIEGWDEWRKHAEMHMLGLIRMGLGLLMDAGTIKRQSIDILAPLLFAVLNEAAMLIGNAEDRAAAREEVGETLSGLLEGLRVERDIS